MPPLKRSVDSALAGDAKRARFPSPGAPCDDVFAAITRAGGPDADATSTARLRALMRPGLALDRLRLEHAFYELMTSPSRWTPSLRDLTARSNEMWRLIDLGNVHCTPSCTDEYCRYLVDAVRTLTDVVGRECQRRYVAAAAATAAAAAAAGAASSAAACCAALM